MSFKHLFLPTTPTLITGVRHEGTPEGKWEKLGGVDSYVATPTIDYPKDKVLLFLPDAYGPGFLNAQVSWLEVGLHLARERLLTVTMVYISSCWPMISLATGSRYI